MAQNAESKDFYREKLKCTHKIRNLYFTVDFFVSYKTTTFIFLAFLIRHYK